MLSDSAAKFIHDGLCAAFDIDPKGEPMTAEQHTSIAHSDGDTPRVDEIDPDLEAYKRAYVMAINYSTGNFGEKFREVEQRLNRRLARTTPDQIRAAVWGVIDEAIERYYPQGFPYESSHDQMFKEIEDDCVSVVVALFDAEVGL